MFHPFTTIHGFQAYPGMPSAGIYDLDKWTGPLENMMFEQRKEPEHSPDRLKTNEQKG